MLRGARRYRGYVRLGPIPPAHRRHHMNGIDILWPMMGAASLTIGLIHMMIWFRQRTQPAHLVFTVAAASVVVLSLSELLAMRAETPERYADVLRWAHVPVAVLVVALVAFVQLQFRLGWSWLGFAAGAMRVGSLLPNFMSGVNLNFQRIDALQRIEVWGHEGIAIPIGDPNPWMLIGQLSNLLLLLFLLDAIVKVWRRGDAAERRRAILVCGSIAGFVLLTGAWTAAVVLGLVRGPLTVNIAFFGIILVMGYELGGDVIRTAQLARQLAQSESNLRDSEQRMQLAAQAAGLGLWTWDIDSNDFWFTEEGSSLLDLAPTKPINRENLLARVHHDDREAVRQAREDAIHHGGDFACEFRLLDPMGDTRWIAAKGRVEYAPSGTPRFLRGVILDITDRRQADERFRQVVEGAPTAMLMVDGNGRIALANTQAENVFGYSRAELLGQCIDMLVPESSRAGHVGDRDDYAMEPQARPMGAGREVFGRCKDGSEVPLEIGLTPIRISDAPLVLVTIIDIGERLRSEQEAALQRDELAHLSRVALLGEISGSLAHELNQPLTAILSNAQAALRFLERDPPDLGEVRDSLVHIVDSDKGASEVIRRLREMLRKEKAAHEPLEINEVVCDVLRLLDSDFLNRNVAVALDLEADLPHVIGDRVQLQQVLLNLVINACDAMSDLGAGRTLSVRTQAVPGPAVEVSVSDIGRGIPPADLQRIFMPFVTSKVEGVGLGLAICGTIIRAHRGKLWATNNPSRGATLHFELPIESSPTGAL